MYSRVVVPLDGSEIASMALDHARNLARQNQIPILIVRAIDPSLADQVGLIGVRPVFNKIDVMLDQEQSETSIFVDQHVQKLTNDGFQASGSVVWGTPAAAIASVLKDGDVIVMTTRGRTGAKRWFLGSAAEDLLKRTQVPVLLVRND
ncbi:MAG TPA: universal stress protein [Thermomicrobiales bacterium]|nr:universal stress protein [Thermomicrobiales bacterium]